MQDNLSIVISADVKPLEQGMVRAEQAISRFDGAAKQATKSSGQAGQALVNLGRVASDAPFGFIAIQNNIEPLIQSLGSLKTSSGGTGAALKALGASLLGPTGVLLGFSLVSSAITVAIQKYGSLGAAIDALFGKEDKLAKKLNELFDEYGKLDEKIVNTTQLRADSSASVQGEIVQVQSLLGVIQSETATRKEKETALRTLKEVNKEYFGQLSSEPSLLANVTAAVDAYTEALVKNAIVKDLTEQYVLANKALRIANDAALLATRGLGSLNAATAQSSAAIGRFGAAYQDVVTPINNVANSVENFNKANKLQFEATRNVQQLKKELAEAVVSANSLKAVSVEPVVKAAKKAKVKAEPQLDFKIPEITFLKIEQQLDEEFRNLNPEPVPLKIFTFNPIELITAQQGIEKLDRATSVYKENLGLLVDTFQSALNPAVDALFGAFESGKNVFESIGQSLKKFIIQLAATVAKAAILAAILQFIPGAGLALGVTGAVKGSTTGFGSLFGSLLGLKKSAAPSFNAGGIAPGGLQMAGQVVFVQRGSDLVGVLNNTNNRIGRVG